LNVLKSRGEFLIGHHWFAHGDIRIRSNAKVNLLSLVFRPRACE
jgi:hypothetical protein